MVTATSRDMILILTSDSCATYVSPAARELTGRPAAALLGTQWLQQVHAEDRDDLLRALSVVRGGVREETRVIGRLRRRDGGWRWIDVRLRHDQIPGGQSIAVARDITAEQTHEQHLAGRAAQLADDATTDQLTGLADQQEFDQQLTQAWTQAWGRQQPLSILSVEVDGFPLYTQIYGPHEGERCLLQVAQALRTHLNQPSDLCARTGSHHFAVLLRQTSLTGARQVAQSLRAAVGELKLQHLGDHTGRVTVSVGAASAVPQAPSPAAVVTWAGIALRRAQALGGGQIEACSEQDQSAELLTTELP